MMDLAECVEIPTKPSSAADDVETGKKSEDERDAQIGNPFTKPQDCELSYLLNQEKVERRAKLVHRMNQPLYKKTARELKDDAFQVLKSIPTICPSKELPPTPMTMIKKDREVMQSVIAGEKLKNLETVKGFVNTKREIFLIQYLIGVKKDELLRLQKLQMKEDRELDAAENRLEEDAIQFDLFLKNIDREAVDALKQVEIETKLKLDKVAEIRKLNIQIVSMKSKIRKLEEVLQEYKTYKQFLTSVSPQEWKEQRQKEKQLALKKMRKDKSLDIMSDSMKLRGRSMSVISIRGRRKTTIRKTSRKSSKELTTDHSEGESSDNASSAGESPSFGGTLQEEDEKPELYFAHPQQLFDIFLGMEEQNLLMIQKSQDTEEALEEVQTAFAMTKRKLIKEVNLLKNQIESMEHLVNSEEKKANDFRVMVKLFSFGQYSEEYQDKLLSELNRKVEAVYTNVIGPNDANLNTLQMMMSIENKLEELFEAIEMLPPVVVEAAEKQRDRHRRMMQRVMKMKAQEELQAERLKRTMEKTLAISRERAGRRLNPRSVPPVRKQRIIKSERRGADDEMDYFFSS